jgi:hypothetical protein
MPTTTFTSENANMVAFYSRFDPGGFWSTSFFEFHGTVTGTELKMGIIGDTYTVVVDGVPQADVAGGAFGAPVTIFTGLSDTAHTVDVVAKTSAPKYLEQNLAVVTGSAPALGFSSGYGPVYNMRKHRRRRLPPN